MRIDPFFARILLTVMMILLVFGLMDLFFAYGAGDFSVLPEASVFIAFVLLVVVLLSFQIRSQIMRD